MLLASKTSTGAAADVVAAVSGRAIRVYFIQYTMDGTGVLTVHFGTAGTGKNLVYGDFVAGGNGVLNLLGSGGVKGPSGEALKITTSANNGKVTVGYDLA